MGYRNVIIVIHEKYEFCRSKILSSGRYSQKASIFKLERAGCSVELISQGFASLDCYATEFLIDGSTLSLVVSDDKKNIQVRCSLN